MESVSMAFGDRDILLSVSLTITSEQRCALAGANGSGKSTLMKILSGLNEPDSGSVTVSKGSRITYLPQSGYTLPEKTIFEAADDAFAYFHEMEEQAHQLSTQIAEVSTHHGGSLDRILLEHHDLQEKLLNSGYFHREARISQVLKGLGFTESDFSRPCSQFSGGWQMRIALARVLLGHADFLLLDEPTNYLDVEARIWLKNYLSRYQGGVLIVSHDRDFLDETVDTVIEIFHASLHRYTGNYTRYEQQREERNQQLIKDYRIQQEEIARIEQFIERFRSKDSKAKQVQSRITKLEKMEIIELPENLKKLHFSFPAPTHSGTMIYTAEGLSRSYGSLDVLKTLDFTIRKGERIAVTGKNGAGKSTLLRILAEADAGYEGSLERGTGLSVGYFAQDSEAQLSGDRSIYEEIEHDCPTELIPKLRNYLGAFLFRGDDMYKIISVLSGGEKSRLALLKLLLQPYNLLILDEPTNHLDISAKDVLLEALTSFTGTLIFVSHDSYFIRNLANRIFYMNPSGLEIFEGDYEYFSWSLENRNRYDSDGDEQKQEPSQVQDEPVKSTGWKDRNALRNRKKILMRNEEQILEKLELAETACEKLKSRMSLPENYTDGEIIKSLKQKLDEAERESDRITGEWEEIHLELTELEQEDE